MEKNKCTVLDCENNTEKQRNKEFVEIMRYWLSGVICIGNTGELSCKSRAKIIITDFENQKGNLN